MTDFLKRLNANIKKSNRYNQELMTAIITGDNMDGTYNCSIKGSTTSLKNVPYLQNGNLKVGDIVLIGMQDGDRQRPLILMPGSNVSGNPLTFDIGIGLDWSTNIGPLGDPSLGVHKQVIQENKFALQLSQKLNLKNNAFVLAYATLPGSIFFFDSALKNVSCYQPTLPGSATPINTSFNFAVSGSTFQTLADSTGIYDATSGAGVIIIQKHSQIDGSLTWQTNLTIPNNVVLNNVFLTRFGNTIGVYYSYAIQNGYVSSPALTLSLLFPPNIVDTHDNGSKTGGSYFQANLALLDATKGNVLNTQSLNLLHGDNAQDTYNGFVTNSVQFDGTAFYQTVWQYDLTGWYILLNPIINVGGTQGYYARWVLVDRNFPFSKTTSLTVGDNHNNNNVRQGVILPFDSNNQFFLFSDLFYKNQGADFNYGGLFWGNGDIHHWSTYYANLNLLVNPNWLYDIGVGGGAIANEFLPCNVPVGNIRLVQIKASLINASITQTTLNTFTSDANQNPIIIGSAFMPLANWQTPGERIQTNFDGNPFTNPDLFRQFPTASVGVFQLSKSALENRNNQTVHLLRYSSFLPLVNNNTIGSVLPNVNSRFQVLTATGYFMGITSSNQAGSGAVIYNSITDPGVNTLDFCGTDFVVDVNNEKIFNLKDMSLRWQYSASQPPFFFEWVAWMTDTRLGVTDGAWFFVLSTADGTILFKKNYANSFSNIPIKVFYGSRSPSVNGGGEASLCGSDGSFVVAAQQSSSTTLIEIFK